MSLAAHMVLDAPLIAHYDLVGLVLSRESLAKSLWLLTLTRRGA